MCPLNSLDASGIAMAGKRHFSLFHVVLQWINGMMLFVFLAAALISCALWRATSPDAVWTVNASSPVAPHQDAGETARPDYRGHTAVFVSEDYHSLFGMATSLLGVLAALLAVFQAVLGYGYGRIVVPGLVCALAGLFGLVVTVVLKMAGEWPIVPILEPATVKGEMVAAALAGRIAGYGYSVSLTTFLMAIAAGGLLCCAALAGWALSKRRGVNGKTPV